MRFAVDLSSNRMRWDKRFWRKPFTLVFLKSDTRRRVSTYPNYFRLVWWKWDFSLEWGK